MSTRVGGTVGSLEAAASRAEVQLLHSSAPWAETRISNVAVVIEKQCLNGRHSTVLLSVAFLSMMDALGSLSYMYESCR